MATATLTREDLARSSLVAYSKYVDPSWYAYPHARLIAERLEDVERGRIKKLMISCPGQHGKSTLVSRNFPAWYLCRKPDSRGVILATYGADYSALWGGRSRDLVQRYGPSLFGVDVKRSQSAADHWELFGHRGVLHTAGVGGQVTGHPAEGLVIDDPIKTREEAESPVMRAKAIEWYKSSVVSRRTDWQILLMTRWHENDLAGWLLETEPGEWTVVNLPALAEPNDPLGRPLGEALCPAFLTREKLLAIQRTVGSYVWASMWEQRPSPRGGGLFKREHARHFDEPKPGAYRFLETGGVVERGLVGTFVTVDTACSTKTSADHTAIAAWGLAHGMLMLLDLDLRRIEGPEIVRAIKLMSARWRTVPFVEDTTQSKHLLSFMAGQGIVFRRVSPGSTDKFTRALPASALWEQGKIVVPVQAPWLAAFERQLYAFTGRDGGEDDAVDCLSMAAKVFREGAGDFWRGSAPVEHRPQNHVEASSLGGGYPG